MATFTDRFIENVYSGTTVLRLECFTATHAAAQNQNTFAFNKHPPDLHPPSYQHIMLVRHIPKTKPSPHNISNAPYPFTSASPSSAPPHKTHSLHKMQRHTHPPDHIPQPTALPTQNPPSQYLHNQRSERTYPILFCASGQPPDSR